MKPTIMKPTNRINVLCIFAKVLVSISEEDLMHRIFLTIPGSLLPLFVRGEWLTEIEG
jgi:hypothetical protein